MGAFLKEYLVINFRLKTFIYCSVIPTACDFLPRPCGLRGPCSWWGGVLLSGSMTLVVWKTGTLVYSCRVEIDRPRVHKDMWFFLNIHISWCCNDQRRPRHQSVAATISCFQLHAVNTWSCPPAGMFNRPSKQMAVVPQPLSGQHLSILTWLVSFCLFVISSKLYNFKDD